MIAFFCSQNFWSWPALSSSVQTGSSVRGPSSGTSWSPVEKQPNKIPPNNTNHQLFLNYTSSSEQGASFTGKNLIYSLDNSAAYGSCYGLPLHFLRCLWKRSYLTVTFVAIFPHEVDTVTVFIPKGAFVGQGTVGHSDIVIIVVSGEGPTLVVGHGVTWWTNEYYSIKAVWWA